MSRSRSPLFAATTDESIVLALFDLANHLLRRGEELARAAGLTTQQWIVLLQIAGDPNFYVVPGAATTPSDIARARGVSRATASVAIRALRDRGLVTERVDRADARRRQLVITSEGRAALARIQPERRAANRRLLGQFSEGSRKDFLAHLHGCLAVLWDAHEQRAVTRRKRAAKLA